MSQTHPHDHTPNAGQPATQQHTQYYIHVLHDLIDMGVEIARELHSQVCSPPEGPEPVAERPAAPSPVAKQDISIAFDRIARTIRRTIALAQKLAEPVEPKSASRFAQNGARNHDRKPAEKDVSKMTDQEIQERLDRLERDLDDELPDGPIADVIANICRDLGITHVPPKLLWRRCIVADLKYVLTRAQTQIDRNADLVAAHQTGTKTTDPPPPLE